MLTKGGPHTVTLRVMLERKASDLHITAGSVHRVQRVRAP